MEYVLNATDEDTRSNISEKAEEELLKKLEEKTQMKKLQKSKSRRRTRSSRWVAAIGFNRKDIIPEEKKVEVRIEEQPEEEEEDEEEEEKKEEVLGVEEEDDCIRKMIREQVYQEGYSPQEGRSGALTERKETDSDIHMKLIPVEITSTFIPNRSMSSDHSQKSTRKNFSRKNLKILEISKKLDAIKKSSMKIRNQMDSYIKTRQPRPKNTFYSPSLKKDSPRYIKKDISSSTIIRKEPIKSFITPKLRSKLPGMKSNLRKSDRYSILSKKSDNKRMFSTIADLRSERKPSMKKQLFQNISIVSTNARPGLVFRSQEGIRRKRKKRRKPIEKCKTKEDISIKKIIEKLSPKNNAHISYWDAKSSPKKIQKKSGMETSRLTTMTKKSHKKKKKRTYTNCFEYERSRSRKRRTIVDRGKSAASQNRSSNLFDLSCFETVGDYSKYKLKRAGSNKSLVKKVGLRTSFNERKKRLKIKKIAGMQKSDIGEIDLSLASNDIKSKYSGKTKNKSVFRNLIKEFLETSAATANNNNIYESNINASKDLSEKVINLLPDKLVEKLKTRKFYDSKAVVNSRGVQHLQPAFHSLLKSRNINLADLTKSSVKNTERSLKRYSDKRRRHTSLNSEKNFFEMFKGRVNYRPSYGYQDNYFNMKVRTKSVIPKKKLT